MAAPTCGSPSSQFLPHREMIEGSPGAAGFVRTAEPPSWYQWVLDGQSQPDLSVSPKKSWFRSSIVWKLTLFVGVLVALNCAVLIGVAYIATSRIIRHQIHERLSTVAADRQEMLAYTLGQQEERATQFAHRGPYPPAPHPTRGWDDQF